MLSSQVKLSADRQTPVKQYAPDLSMWGHKNIHDASIEKKIKGVNAFPHDKILDQTKLKAFAGIISAFDRVENIVGKGEIACTSNFSFSHNVL